MPWLSFRGICMQSCSQSTDLIFIIECKLVIAVFCLNQLRKVKHQTEKYCRFKTRTYCLLQAVPNKFFACYSTFSDQYLDCGLHIIWWCCQMGVLSKLQSCSEMKSIFAFFPFPAPDHFFIVSLGMSAQCLRKYFWVMCMAGGMLQLQCPSDCRLGLFINLLHGSFKF